MAKEVDKSDDDANITCLPTIAVLNPNVGASPQLPVKLDRNLVHIKFLVGRKNNKSFPLTALWSLIYSRVGGTIGFPNYFEGVVMLNPHALVKIFTSSGGKNSSIFMHGIVSTDNDSDTTTEFP